MHERSIATGVGRRGSCRGIGFKSGSARSPTSDSPRLSIGRGGRGSRRSTASNERVRTHPDFWTSELGTPRVLGSLVARETNQRWNLQSQCLVVCNFGERSEELHRPLQSPSQHHHRPTPLNSSVKKCWSSEDHPSACVSPFSKLRRQSPPLHIERGSLFVTPCHVWSGTEP